MARYDLAKDNIGISALIPGPVVSNIFHIGQTRLERFANEGPPPQRRRLEPDPRWMQPERVGEMVAEGVLSNQLYIFTHRMFLQGMQEKFDKMLRSLPTEPDDPELVTDLAIFTSNPIYSQDA